jgi:hypothetical protein
MLFVQKSINKNLREKFYDFVKRARILSRVTRKFFTQRRKAAMAQCFYFPQISLIPADDIYFPQITRIYADDNYFTRMTLIYAEVFTQRRKVATAQCFCFPQIALIYAEI